MILFAPSVIRRHEYTIDLLVKPVLVRIAATQSHSFEARDGQGPLPSTTLTDSTDQALGLPGIQIPKASQPKLKLKSYIGQIITLSILILGLAVGSVWILVPAAKQAFQNRQRSAAMSNIRQIAAALNAYRRLHRFYPTPTVYDSSGKPLYSWRVLILPQLGFQSLYDRFQLDQAFDSPTNISLLSQMPPVYVSPANQNALGLYESNYALLVGQGPSFRLKGPMVDPVNMSDSPNETILVAENA